MWDAYEVVARLVEEPDEYIYRVAVFVTCLGKDALRIYNSLPFSSPADKKMSVLLELLDRYCLGESNVIYDRFIFNRRQQEEHENFDTYLTRSQRFSAPMCIWTNGGRAVAGQNCMWGSRWHTPQAITPEKDTYPLTLCGFVQGK